MTFDGQREGEKVLFIFRRHILTAKRGLIFLIIMTGLGILPMVMWPGDVRMFWIFLGVFIFGIFGAVYAYILWYFSIYIVTNERIRQISQRGLFKKTVIDLGMDKIQSISMSVPGLLAGIFGYGTIKIQTGVGDLIITMVPKPKKVLNKLQNAEKESNG